MALRSNSQEIPESAPAANTQLPIRLKGLETMAFTSGSR